MVERRLSMVETIRRTRQHHALEHATIHLLSARFPHRRFAGLSDPWGFTLYGDVPEEEVRRAAGDALLHLQAGEEALALHPNCGTNLATQVVLVTVATLLGTSRSRGFLDRLTVLLVLTTAALLAAGPLGLRLQRLTTMAYVADRWLAAVKPLNQPGQPAHRVLFT